MRVAERRRTSREADFEPVEAAAPARGTIGEYPGINPSETKSEREGNINASTVALANNIHQLANWKVARERPSAAELALGSARSY